MHGLRRTQYLLDPSAYDILAAGVIIKLGEEMLLAASELLRLVLGIVAPYGALASEGVVHTRFIRCTI